MKEHDIEWMVEQVRRESIMRRIEEEPYFAGVLLKEAILDGLEEECHAVDKAYRKAERARNLVVSIVSVAVIVATLLFQGLASEKDFLTNDRIGRTEVCVQIKQVIS